MPSRPIHTFSVHPPLAVAGQAIGLLGGSFNPAHEGHVLISQIALARLGLDRVWWLVTPGNPLKSHADLETLDMRMQNARRVADDARIIVTGFEQALGATYTVDTLTFLSRRFHGVRFVWLMGADSLASMHRWRRWQTIFATFPIAVIDRPGWHLKANASIAARTFAGGRVPERRCQNILTRPGPVWTLLTGPLSAQSSTAIRRSQTPWKPQR